MLEVAEIDTYYGLSHILFGVSLRVERGEVVCLLGRNGAGKTTTMRSIMGLTPPRRGTIRFKGQPTAGVEPYKLARQGIAYVPDNRRIFAELTVGENLEIAARDSNQKGEWNLARVFELFPVLQEKRSRKGGHLSGGEQKMLAIGRALMTNPDFILLDEPMEGLAPLLVRAIEDQILQLKAAGLTVLLAEQNINSALRVSNRGYVIDDGHIRYTASVQELWENQEVRNKYLLV
jgi:branched-chain amino acid transport system ATP-binding protein